MRNFNQGFTRHSAVRCQYDSGSMPLRRRYLSFVAPGQTCFHVQNPLVIGRRVNVVIEIRRYPIDDARRRIIEVELGLLRLLGTAPALEFDYVAHAAFSFL